MIGYFDEDRFGRGYGEENEFCQRAIKKGWCNLVTPNLYVYHKGGASSGQTRRLSPGEALVFRQAFT
jgi:GT2 family glycosyltransferase